MTYVGMDANENARLRTTPKLYLSICPQRKPPSPVGCRNKGDGRTDIELGRQCSKSRSPCALASKTIQNVPLKELA